jgi:hypothetical protein
MIEIPKITKKIALCDYAEEFGKETISVWVNVPRGLLYALEELRTMLDKPDEELVDKALEIIGEFWNMSRDEVEKLLITSTETDPKFFLWLIQRTIILIFQHRGTIKKKWPMQPLKSPQAEKPVIR